MVAKQKLNNFSLNGLIAFLNRLSYQAFIEFDSVSYTVSTYALSNIFTDQGG